MYYRILETDEAINDLKKIVFSVYDYTRDIKSGERFMTLYDATAASMSIFPSGFSSTSIEYRGYEIHMLPFGNYNMFFIINDKQFTITMLRVLYQKQDWQRILHLENLYHSKGETL